MKKMFNKKFFFILGSAIFLLIVLSIGMIFFTKENIKTFNKEGYIIASGNKDGSIKYYFDEGTSYKKNISSQLVFEDTSGEKVTVDTDNFMHYTDGGIKFLKNGVIMDLDSVGLSTVPYYNITDKALLDYSKKSYFIETIDKTLAFNNLAGRISDNKYIFAGVDIKLQLPGNENLIEGDYFEVLYVEDGVIKVENQEVAYQSTAEGSFILVNDSVKIDLGNKRIYLNDEEKMSLSQMTIDGNENIEIIPEEEEDESGTGDGTGQGNNDGTGNEGTGNEPGTGDNQGGEQNPGNPGEGTGDGNGGSGSGNTSQRSASVELVKASVDANSISANFLINNPDNTIKGDLVLHITNTDTGKRVYSTVIDKTQPELTVGVSTLSPDSNYIISINEETDEEYDTQYFQKLFKTKSLGISLEKKYITQESIAYEIVFEEESEVKSATITLYDENYNVVGSPMVVNPENNVVTFGELTYDTSYNIRLDNVIMQTLEFGENYYIEKSIKTLKPLPYLEGLTTSVDDETNTFTIGVDRVVDERDSITKYSYYIYEADAITSENIDTILPVKIIERPDKGKINIGIDGELVKPKTNYKFKVVAEYFDNEKYGEFETELSDNFILSGKPTIEFVLNNDETTFNKIVGKIILNDDSCTVPMNGRSCSSVGGYRNNFKLDYKIINSSEKNTIEHVSFDFNTLEADITVENLLANTEYVFNLYGDVDLLDGQGIRKEYLIGTFRASTSTIEILTVDWKQNASTKEDLINLSAKISASGENQNLGDSIANMTINLYSGDVADQLKAGAIITPLVSKQIYIENREEYYNNYFTINTLNTFGITDQQNEIVDEETGEITYEIIKAIDILKAMTNDSLLTNYTIEIKDVYDEDFKNQLPIENNYFKFVTPPLFRLEYELETPKISATEITNIELKEDKELSNALGTSYNRNLADTIIVGYKVNAVASVDRISQYLPVKELIYYVCSVDRGSDCTIEEAIEVRRIDVSQTTNYETLFFVDKGSSHSVNDEKLARGHDYIFKLKFSLDSDNNGEADTYYPIDEVRTPVKETPKQSPSYKVYIFNTNANQANYKINYFDFDSALYEQKIYYTIDDELKNFVPEEEPEEELPEEIPGEEIPGDEGNEDLGDSEGGQDEQLPDEETGDDVVTKDDEVTDDNTGEEVPEEPGDSEEPEDPEVPIEPEPEPEEEFSVDMFNCRDYRDAVTYRTETECDFTLEGLSVDSVYKVKFKKALKRGSSNVVRETVGQYIFDGEYIYDADTVTFTNVTSDSDNRLKIKINENELNKKYVSRISAYEILLTTDDGQEYTKVYPTEAISTCGDEENSYKCIIVDYADIKSFKTKNITVKVTAYYDSGIIDNVFVSSNENIVDALTNQIGYILQKNNVYNEKFVKGEYIQIIASGGVKSIEYPSGIYGFGFANKKRIELIRKIDLATYTFAENPSTYNYTVSYVNDSINIPGTGGPLSINNKLLSMIDLSTENDTFKFNSIIPKIKATSEGLVNGAKLTLELTGVDEEILKNEFKEEDGKYYLYIDIYKDAEKTGGVYKSEKVEIGEIEVKDDKQTVMVTGAKLELTKYMPYTTYYYEVSAYLLKNSDYQKTILFDAGNSNDYEAKLYEFSTLTASQILYNGKAPSVEYESKYDNETKAYLKRSLILKMTSAGNKNDTNETFIGKYNVIFEFYDINDNMIINQEITELDKTTALRVYKAEVDITPTAEEIANNGKGGYVFGNESYKLKTYMVTDVYESVDTPDGKVKVLLDESTVTLKELSEPTYTIEKTESVNTLKFKVTVTDRDRVIKDGKYCAVLLSSSQQPIAGISPKCGLSVNELKKEQSYSGLTSDTLYTFKVYADVYMNNFDDVEQNREIYRNLLVSTSTSYGVALGLVTAYGSKSSVTLSFDSGVNIKNIKQIDYTLFEQVNAGTGAVAIMSETYTMGSNKNFTTKNGIIELVINPSGLSLSSGYSYSIDVAFWVEQGGKLVKLNNKNYNYGVKFK